MPLAKVNALHSPRACGDFQIAYLDKTISKKEVDVNEERPSALHNTHKSYSCNDLPKMYLEYPCRKTGG
jgi:hypothetical protein